MKLSNWFDGFLHDLRYASRLLRANPMVAGVVVLMLALGIGANTAIFSVMNAVVLRSLPVPDPQQLVFLRTSSLPNRSTQTGDSPTSFPLNVFERLRSERAVFSDLIAYVPLSNDKTAVRFGSEPEEANANMVSGNFFSGLGVQAVCGRTLTLDDEKNHAPVAVLSHGYWTRRFGSDCAVVGQTLHVAGVPLTIVGVSVPGFIGIENARATDVWIPLQNRRELNAWGSKGLTLYGSRHWWCLMLIGRLAPGVDEKEAQAKLNPVFQTAAYEHLGNPEEREKRPNLYFANARGIPGLRDQYSEPLRILLSMVAVVLAIACANVALLMVARNTARQREFSIRVALGGGRGRLFRQLLAESLVLVAGGAGLGWFFSRVATDALSSWSELQLSLAPDRNVLLFTLAVSLAVALLFGLAPLRSAARVPAGLALRSSSTFATGGPRSMLGRKAIVAAQISLCLTLLIGAGLLVRSLRNLEQLNLGLRTSGLLVFGISPQIRGGGDEAVARFYEALLNRLRTLPGVESVTLMQNRLGSGWSNNTGAFVDGKNPQGDRSSPMRWNAVGPDYFRTLGTPLLAGRDFTEADTGSAPKVAVVNQTFAQRYLPNQNPLGRQVAMGRGAKSPQYTIVGVAADSKYTGVRENDVPMAYFPYKQISGLSAMHVELRTTRNPVDSLPEVRRAVREFAPDLPLLRPMTQQQQFESTFSQQRLFARLSAFFGLLAVLLVASGLYGTLAYMVSRRTSEVGIRMALGAQRGQVLWMVLRESLVVCLVGIGIGLPLAIACSRLLRSMLFGVTPGDSLTFAAALAGIALVSLAAGIVPAYRAASINPMSALRNE